MPCKEQGVRPEYRGESGKSGFEQTDFNSKGVKESHILEHVLKQHLDKTELETRELFSMKITAQHPMAMRKQLGEALSKGEAKRLEINLLNRKEEFNRYIIPTIEKSRNGQKIQQKLYNAKIQR